MDFSCLSSSWNEDNHEMNKNISDEKDSMKNSCFSGKFDEGVNGADRSANYHEPLEASQGARIMANESAREKEELEQKFAFLETEINAKEEEIAFLKETIFGRDKEIFDLKEKLSQLQQNRQRNQFDFVKKMATMDEKLQQARRNIKELEDGLNFSFVKNETKEDSQSEPKTFNGKAYFELQPSWFDTLSNNAGCLNVKKFPVTAKDLEVLKNAKSSSSEPAEGKGYCDTRPSWFDTPSNNAGFLEIENFPVKAKDLEAMKKAQSNSKLFITPAQDCVDLKFQPPRAADVSAVRAQMKKHSSPPQREEEFNKIASSVGQKVNPFSKKAKHSPLDKFGRTEVDKCTPPVQAKLVVFDITNLSSGRQIDPLSKRAKALDRPRGTGVEKNTPPVQVKGVPSNNITDSSGNKVNPFSKRAKGATRPTHIPDANFVQGSTFSYLRPLPPILASTVPSGSQVGFVYKQNNQRSIRQTEQGFLSRTFNKWFGSYY